MRKKSLIEQLNIRYPIFQAPMAGVTTPQFVAKVSNYGALGNIGAGYLSKKATREHIKDVKRLTNAPFGINVFVPEHHDIIDEQVELAHKLMKEHFNVLGISDDKMPDYKTVTPYEEQIDVILAEKVPVCSFTFGIPDETFIRELKKQNTFLIGTATTVTEAQRVEEAGMDAVVIQGSEAGGHRGTFFGEEKYIGTMALTPQAVDYVSIPVIAAGGIMDGRGLVAALSLGAEAAQFGTAFLTTKECGTNPIHKRALLQATEDETVLTKAFSGKTARGLQNEFIKQMQPFERGLLPFPYQNTFTQTLRQIATEQQNIQYMSLWSGQAPRLTKDVTVKELLDSILADYERVKSELIQIK